MRSNNEVEYTVILLITDGGVTDFEDTKKILVKMSKQPVSVVLVIILCHSTYFQDMKKMFLNLIITEISKQSLIK